MRALVICLVFVAATIWAATVLADGTCADPGWHEPNTHEHGDAPPPWVVGSAWPPFTQCRESHVGYKGIRGVTPSGVESYLIVHILSTAGARSHGDHDYQLWMRDPSGAVSHWGQAGSSNTSMLDFGSPPPLICAKTGVAPSISETNGVEAWYNAEPGSLVFARLRWFIVGPNDAFCPGIVLGDGSQRFATWIVSASRFPGAHAQFVSSTLAPYCATDGKNPAFGCHFKFDRVLTDFAAAPMALPN